MSKRPAYMKNEVYMNVWDALFEECSQLSHPDLIFFGYGSPLSLLADCILPIVQVIKSLPTIFPDFT